MLGSIHTNDPDLPVHVRLINCDAQTHDHVGNMSNVIVQQDIYTTKPGHIVNRHGVHTTKGIKYLLSRHRKEVWGVYTEDAFYSCMIKYDTMTDLLQQYTNVIYVDVDTIVRGSIKNSVAELPFFDIGLFFDKKILTFPHAGLIVARNTDKTKKCISFMRDYFDHKIKSGDINIGEGDGELLYNTCTVNALKIYRLSKQWKDEGQYYNDESIMWSGRSERKFKNEQYINEYTKYLNHDKQDRN